MRSDGAVKAEAVTRGLGSYVSDRSNQPQPPYTLKKRARGRKRRSWASTVAWSSSPERWTQSGEAIGGKCDRDRRKLGVQRTSEGACVASSEYARSMLGQL